MKPFRVPELVLGCLLTVAVFAIGRSLGPIGPEPMPTAASQPLDLWSTLSAAGASISAVGTLILAVVAVVQIRFLIDANKHASTSAETSRRTLELTNRPWVTVDDISVDSDLVYQADGAARVTVVFWLKNTGNSPAINVQVNHRLELRLGQSIDQMIETRNQAKSLPEPAERTLLGMTIPPGAEREARFNTIITRQEMEAGVSFPDGTPMFTSQDQVFFNPCIVGAVSYRFPFQNGRHVTDFSARLYCKIDPALAFYPTAGNIQKSDMVVAMDWTLGGIAD